MSRISHSSGSTSDSIGAFTRYSRYAASLPLARGKSRTSLHSSSLEDKLSGRAESIEMTAFHMLPGINDDAELIELYALDASTERWDCARPASRSQNGGCASKLRGCIGSQNTTRHAQQQQQLQQQDGSEEGANIDSHSCLIHPFSKFRILWNVMMLLVLSSILLVLPISIAFFYNDDGYTWLPYNIICDSLFIIDITLNFKTGTVNEKDVIMNPKSIARTYAKTWFAVDVISVLPIDYAMLFASSGSAATQGSSIRIFRLIKLMQLIRLVRFSRMLRYFSTLQEIFNVATAVAGLVKMAIIAFLVSHWSACIQFYVPAMMDFPADSWVVCTNVKNSFWFDQYVNAWFKALSHQLGIGYGQCAAFNMVEIWVSILSMYIASTTWLILGAHTIDIMYGVNTSRKLFEGHMQEVHEYLVAMKFPMSLRERIYDYYDSRFGEKMFNEVSILKDLSDPLKQEIIRHNSEVIIKKTPLLSAANTNFVNDVIAALKPHLFQHGDYIYKANTRGTKMYLLQDGIVEILNVRGQTVTKLLGGSFFGEISLITDACRTASARAVTNCHVFSLEKDVFDTVFSDYRDMRMKLLRIATKRALILAGDFHKIPPGVDNSEHELHTIISEILNTSTHSPGLKKKPDDESKPVG